MYCFRENSDLKLVNISLFFIVFVVFLLILLSNILSMSTASYTRHKLELICIVRNEILNWMEIAPCWHPDMIS